MKNITCLIVALIVCASVVAEDDWTESRWGDNDEAGAANYITAASVKLAASLVKTGKTYALGIETNATTPAFSPRYFRVTVLQPGQVGGATLGPTQTSYNDDIVSGWLGVGSQIDGLGHIGINNTYYNGFAGTQISQADGLTRLGIENVPPIVARGVLLNMARYFDTDVVSEGTAFNQAEIEAAADQQGVEIRQGDVVLFHTGWLSLIGQQNERFAAGEPGLGVNGARFLASRGVVAVGADSWGVEVIPFETGSGVFQVHQDLLAKNGTYLLENMNTAELAADGATEFMFVLGPARVTGAVQMIVNPIAIR